MKRKKLMTKVLPAIMAASMVMSLAPTTAFAVTGSQVAKDGTYTATSHVVRTEEDSDDDWDEYDVEVAVSVKDGKFSDIVVTPKNGYTSENASYVNKAYTKSKGIKTLLVGKDATAENIETWSTVSSATRTSKAVKEAALEALNGAPEAKQEAEYQYVYAAIPYAEYWNAEGVQAAGSTASSTEVDIKGETDKGAFDAVTRATTNHGLHRGNYQQDVTIYDTDGNAYEMDHWTEDGKNIVLTDGTTIGFARGTITLSDNTTRKMDYYKITGIKYVPVKVKTSDYEAFKAKYEVVENGGTLAGGYSEFNLKSYTATAKVTENTNGLKTATKNADGSFSFSARQTGTDSGIEGQELKTITDLDKLVYSTDNDGNKIGGVQDSSTFGDFLRVDFRGDYGDLAANMQTVEWKYYPDGDTSKEPVATYGTKFAADNWMHKSMGIQLGLTESQRCQLPEGYDGSGTWTVTVYALGYADTTVTVKVDKDDIHSAHIVSDVTALQAAITNAEKVNAEGKDAWVGDWDHFQEHLTEAKDVLAAYEKDATKGTTQEAVNQAVADLNDTMDHLTRYMLMDIPYADFYASDVTNSDKVDVVTSATLQKSRNGSLANGSYHSKTDGTEIAGVTYPVAISAADWSEIDWSQYKQVTDKDSVEITTSIKGKEQTATYTGKQALFEQNDYSYYLLSAAEIPDNYKTIAVKDGKLSFGKIEGTEVTKIADASATLKTNSKYGDYEIDLDRDIEQIAALKNASVYSVIVNTTDGSSYGMRHVENIWKGTEIAWSVGFKTDSKGCPLSSEQYKDMGGKTIQSITYYTSAGNYEITVGKDRNGLYVPCKFAGYDSCVSVETADVESGKTTVSAAGLPEDYKAVYSVDGLAGVEVKDGKLAFDASTANAGSYTLKVTDENKKYVDLSANFVLTTDKTTVAYNDAMDKLLPAEGFSDDSVSAYVKNIKSVTVNGTSYNATGKGAVTIINTDGTINTDAAPFKDAEEGTEFKITVTAEGYTTDYSFTYTTSGYTYAYAAIPYAEYYANEDVQNGSSTAVSGTWDTNGEYDTGAFDTVTRATANHGLHRGSFQQDVVIYDTDGNTFEPVYWTDGNTAVLADGKTLVKASDRNTGITTLTCDGKTTTYDRYEIKGIKYVPVKVKTKNYEAFKKSYAVVENGETLAGGYSENNLSSYFAVAAVDENTNGLKTADINADGTFSFGKRAEGTSSGIQNEELKTVSQEDLGVEVVDSSKYGDFLRVDLKKNYGDLGAKMQSVIWTYYGNGDTPLATYGTKFAADNWMHKSMGIQLGLTESERCTLPEGTDGSGKWELTIVALGYADTTVTVNVEKSDIHKATPVSDTSKLEAAIKAAEALNKDDYTEKTWADLETELKEAKDDLTKAATGKTSQESVAESTEHLNAAIAALEKVYVQPDGLANEAADGNHWYYYKDGKIATDVTTVAHNANGWWYVKDGEVDFSYNGFANNENGWWYVNGGQVDFTVDSIIEGTVDGQYGWWHVVGSQVTYDITIACNTNGWWRVEGGKVNFNYNGITNNENGWWKVEGGQVNFNYTGVANNENGWWRVEGGQVNFNYTGIANNENGWWYIRGGQVDFGYTGVAENENGWWRVEGGQVNFNFNGLAQNENGWWYIRGGKVDFSYNGTANWNGHRYTIRGGQVIF